MSSDNSTISPMLWCLCDCGAMRDDPLQSHKIPGPFGVRGCSVREHAVSVFACMPGIHATAHRHRYVHPVEAARWWLSQLSPAERRRLLGEFQL